MKAFVVVLCVLFASACSKDAKNGSPGDNSAIEVAPAQVELLAGGNQQFTAVADRDDATPVTWSVAEAGGGSIDESGLYTAPTRTGRFTVVARSVARPADSASAHVVVRGGTGGDGGAGGTGGVGGTGGSKPDVMVAIEPPLAEVLTAGEQQFFAVVLNAEDTGVTWSVEQGSAGGTIDAAGLYLAPNAPGTYRVVVASNADPTRTATAEIVVVEPTSTDATGILPAESRTTWQPGLNAVGGIPADNDPVRPATVYLPAGDPWGGFSVDPALADGSTDTRRAIQEALDAAARQAGETRRKIVYLAAGEYRIRGEGLFVPSFVTLRGTAPRGANATRLVKPPGTSYAAINMGHRWFSLTQPVDLAEDTLHGSRTVSVVSNPGYKVGELVFIDQLDDPTRVGSWYNPLRQANRNDDTRGWFSRQSRPTGQALEITGVEGNRLTFSTPVRLTYYTSNSAQIIRYAGHNGSSGPVADNMKWSGVEDLYVAYGDGGDGGGNIHLFATSYSWVKNVESAHSGGTNVAFEATFRSVLRDSFVHSTVSPNPGGGGYGIGMLRYAADNLVENNISWNFNKVIIMRATGGGNVIGYNYFEDGWGSGYPSIPEVGLNAAHYATPHHELLEGNQAWNISGDAFWGNSIHLTFYRNHVTGRRRSVPPLRLTEEVLVRFVEVPEWQLWSAYIGNVIGSPGMSPAPQRSFIYEDSPPWGHDPMPVWQVGREANAGQWGQDERVVSTLVRHGNLDYVTNAIAWDPAVERRDLPRSLYLDSKPEFFGNRPWPWVTPEDGSKTFHVLPARERFDAMMGL